jgi:hypothetical protein
MPGLDPGIHRPSQDSFLRIREEDGLPGLAPGNDEKTAFLFRTRPSGIFAGICGPDSALDKIYFN